MVRKIVGMLAVAAMLLGSVSGLTACGSAAPHEHIWNDGEITTAATCTTEGVKTFTCTVKGCNETTTERVSKLEHVYDSGVVTDEPSCSLNGVKTFTCTLCGNSYEEAIDKTEHSWDNGLLTVVPTLNSAGEITYSCDNCDETKKQTVSPRDSFAEQFYSALPTSTAWKYGYTEEYDSFSFVQILNTDEQMPKVWKADGVEISAGKIYSEKYAAVAYTASRDMDIDFALSFVGEESETRVNFKIIVNNSVLSDINTDEKDWTYETEDAISLTAGESVYVVFRNAGTGTPCGSFDFTVTSECMHIWDNGEVTTDPTCGSDGVRTFTCEKCGETHEEPVTERPPHAFTGEWQIGDGGHYHKCKNCDAVDGTVAHNYIKENTEKRVEATCHSDGKKYMVCECGAETEIAITERLPHDFTGEWQIGTDGHYHKCKNCDAVDQTVAHSFNKENTEKRVEATCHSDGKKYMVCECGAETEVAITERLPHDFTGAWVNTSAGGHYHACLNDGCDAVSASERHEMKDNGEAKAPTNDENGIMNTKCDICGYESTRVIPSLNHKKSDKYAHDENGHWFTCSEHDNCGEKFEPANHRFETQLTEQTKPATCKEDGYTVWACVCGATEQRVISKDTAEHSYGNYINDGENGHYRECSVCGNIESGLHSIIEEILSDATCTEAGEKKITCGLCDYETTEIIESNGHSYGEWAFKDKDTHERVCADCGDIVSETHKWHYEVTVRPTGAEHGVETATCTECGYSETHSIHLTANYKEQFNNSESGWLYGYTGDYNFGTNKFTFNTAIISDGVFIKPKADGQEFPMLELKDGWINVSEDMAVIGYKFTEAQLVSAQLRFVGDSDEMRLSVRYVLVSGEEVKSFRFCGPDGKSVYANEIFEVSENDILYAVLNREENTTPKGSIDYELTAHYTGDWLKDQDGIHHYKECDVCKDRFFTAEHSWNDGEVTEEPTDTENGVKTFTCNDCGQTRTEVIPATSHIPADDWSSDSGGHWHECTADHDCGDKLDYAAHDFTVRHDADGHWKECTVCGYTSDPVSHEWGDGVITVRPSLTSKGLKTFTCSCGESKTEEVPEVDVVDFKQDFTVAEGQPGAWSYGTAQYSWLDGGVETFEFTETQILENDTWKADGVQIKAGWIDGGVAIAYTSSADVKVKLTLNFVGGVENTRVITRIGVKDSEGNLYGNPEGFWDGNGQKAWSVEKEYDLKAGDTIYFIFFNEGNSDANKDLVDAFPNGELDITLTRIFEQQAD